MSYPQFFQAATGNPPYDYQCRLATGRAGAVESAAPGAPTAPDPACQSLLINIPTGLGKTAAVVLAWLWNRVGKPANNPNAPWPRRLVYCLPMRTLVEQTQQEVKRWLANLMDHAKELDLSTQAQDELRWLQDHSPIILMGGEEGSDWDIYPEKPAILIGTQDMLLSRALNRGYGMSRYRWPMHFGLLNNDCLWVMDETQLMGVGVETSAQFEGFRNYEKQGSLGGGRTWWMSATLETARLATVDHPQPAVGWCVEKLTEMEQTAGRPFELISASKQLSLAAFKLNAATKASYAREMAALIKERHQTGSLTLVILNRVARAREVYEALVAGKKPLYSPEKVALIHSRFRPLDRARHTQLLFGKGERIVIATQAVEAGVDVSARLLITELAPWSSLVQRLGRCNRRAEFGEAQVLWVDIEPKDDKDELLRPYSETELKQARAAIAHLTNASPQALKAVNVPEEKVIRPIIRRRDLVDLFDTTPDICGQDLDVSRYVRDGDDNDVQFFWRSVAGVAPSATEHPANRDELCRVAIGDAARFLGKKPRAWRWNPLTEEWEEARFARPGRVYLLDVNSGGYSDETGWTGDPKDKPTPHPPNDGESPKHNSDRLTFAHQRESLAEHTAMVVNQMNAIADALALREAEAVPLRTAALWHDLGKAHSEFQAMLVGSDPLLRNTLWAKSESRQGKCRRPGFRHELASALTWLQAGSADAVEGDLVAYLIAAHHGKVRLSIRSLPNETGDEQNPDKLFARGIWQDDKLPAMSLGELTLPEIALDLSFMRMGEGPRGPSWLARTVALRDRFGPFHLACLETLLRAADARASRDRII